MSGSRITDDMFARIPALLLEGTTKAELIRQALRDAAGGSLRVKPRARGVFSGPVDLASNAEEHLAASGFGE